MSSMVPGEQPAEELDELVAGLDLDGPPDDGDDEEPPAFGGLLDQSPPELIPGDRISYELAEWSGSSRAQLDALLTSADLPHLWQGTELTVPAEHADSVEELLDDVESGATPALEPDRERIVYEVGAWSSGFQTSLADSLVVADIPYEWNEAGDLVVYADDEERVDEILEAMPDPDDDERGGDGLDAQAVLSELFLVAGRLARNPRDADGVLGLLDGADRIESLPLPFGFESAAWRALVARATRLRGGLQAPADGSAPAWSDEEVAEAAADLRDRLRRIV